jgi:hypothetical protein
VKKKDSCVDDEDILRKKKRPYDENLLDPPKTIFPKRFPFVTWTLAPGGQEKMRRHIFPKQD